MKITMLGSGSFKSSLSHRLIKIAGEFSRGGWRVNVILPSADKYNDFTVTKLARINGARLVQPWQLATRKPFLNLIPYLFTATLALFRSRPQVVYIYKPTPITVIGILPKLLLGKTLIVDIDDLGSEVMRRQNQSPLAVWLVARSEKIAMRLADKIIVTSTYLATVTADTYPNKPVLVVPNGVDAAEYKPVAESDLRPHIYYFGALNSIDLVHDLLTAVRSVHQQMPDVRLSVIGDGSALDEAKALATDLGIGDIVSFPGFVDMVTVQDYVQFGDIAVCYQPDIATVRAASNMKVFQYMALCTVPIVSNVGDLSSYVLSGNAGVVVPAGSPQHLSEALVDILQNPNDRIGIARLGRQLAEHAYSWQARAETIRGFLDREAA